MDIDVRKKYDSYPDHIQRIAFAIRALIFEVVQRDNIEGIIETLK